LYLCNTERMVRNNQVLTTFLITMKDMKEVSTTFLIEII